MKLDSRHILLYGTPEQVLDLLAADFKADLSLELLGYFAEQEESALAFRNGEGIAVGVVKKTGQVRIPIRGLPIDVRAIVYFKVDGRLCAKALPNRQSSRGCSLEDRPFPYEA